MVTITKITNYHIEAEEIVDNEKIVGSLQFTNNYLSEYYKIKNLKEGDIVDGFITPRYVKSSQGRKLVKIGYLHL